MLKFLTYTAYGVLGVVGVGLEECVCWWCVAVQHTTSTHSTQDRHLLHQGLYDCEKLEKEREKLIAHISREDDWPVQKSVLVNKYLQQLSQFTNFIDFKKL